MSGEARREKLLELISKTEKPLSGTELGKITGVSRQVVVQDIALLRSQGYEIVSTARGYMPLEELVEERCTRLVKVCHTEEEVELELQTIVDLGGSVLDVMVNHRTYGQVTAALNIKSRRDVQNFIKDLESSKSSLLSNVTSGYHFHTISAESEDILNEIEHALKEKGLLAELLEHEQTLQKGKVKVCY